MRYRQFGALLVIIGLSTAPLLSVAAEAVKRNQSNPWTTVRTSALKGVNNRTNSNRQMKVMGRLQDNQKIDLRRKIAVGPGSDGGGDGFVAEFTSIVRVLLTDAIAISNGPSMRLPSGKQIELTYILGRLPEIDIASMPNELRLSGEKKDAINNHETKTIRFSEASWLKMNDLQKARLALHEVVSAVGIDDKGYLVSEMILNLAYRLSPNPLFDHEKSIYLGIFEATLKHAISISEYIVEHVNPSGPLNIDYGSPLHRLCFMQGELESDSGRMIELFFGHLGRYGDEKFNAVFNTEVDNKIIWGAVSEWCMRKGDQASWKQNFDSLRSFHRGLLAVEAVFQNLKKQNRR